MKKILLAFSAVIALLSFNSCKKDPPVALFTTAETSYKMNEPVVFVNQSVNAKDFAWDFGDGNTSSEENPTHAYATAGDFAVTLTSNGSGGTDFITDSINIMPDLTGMWYTTLSSGGGFNNFTGTMNMVHHEDNTLTGSFVYNDGLRTATLKSASQVSGNQVTIEWDAPAYKFKATVNAAASFMSGSYSGTNGQSGKWSATKL